MCQGSDSVACLEGAGDHPTSSKSPSTNSTARPQSRNVLRQAWHDYTRGRKLRKQEALVSKTTEVEQSRPAGYGIGWKFYRGKDYPWRISRTIPGDDNWRGTWVLEVKDISEVHWTRQRVHDGRSWKSVTLPDDPHWPTSAQMDEILRDCLREET